MIRWYIDAIDFNIFHWWASVGIDELTRHDFENFIKLALFLRMDVNANERSLTVIYKLTYITGLDPAFKGKSIYFVKFPVCHLGFSLSLTCDHVFSNVLEVSL
jgi:hypothetical protein